MSSLKSFIMLSDMVEIQALQKGEALDILKEWLMHNNRNLTEIQYDYVEQALNNCDKITMLHLRLVFDRVKRWHSYDEFNVTFPPTVIDLIQDIFADLEHLHGKNLVEFIMQLITASHNGLSEDDIINIVSGSDFILGHKGEVDAVLRYHEPPIRRLPPLVFLRFRRDLGNYLVERGEHGVRVLSLYHRQFWEGVKARYLDNAEKRYKVNNALADYFSGKMSAAFPERNINPHPIRFDDSKSSSESLLPNRQKISELPYALLESKRFPELIDFMTDLANLESIFTAGKVYAEELLLHYHSVLNYEEETMTNIIIMNSPSEFDACVQTQLFPKNQPKNCCKLSKKGDIFVVGCEAVCRVYDSRTGHLNTSFVDHKGLVTAVCFSPSCDYVLSAGSEMDAYVWSSTTGELIFPLSGHKSWVTCCTWCETENQSYGLTGCFDGIIFVWSMNDRSMVTFLEGHISGPVTTCCFISNEKEFLIVAGSESGNVVAWNAWTQSAVVCIDAGSPINAVVCSRDGLMIAVASLKLCTIWHICFDDSQGGRMDDSTPPNRWKLVHKLTEHASEVMGCSFSDDGQEIVTCGADRNVLIFSTVTGALFAKLWNRLDLSQWSNLDDDHTFFCPKRVFFVNNNTQLITIGERFRSVTRDAKSLVIVDEAPDIERVAVGQLNGVDINKDGSCFAAYHYGDRFCIKKLDQRTDVKWLVAPGGFGGVMIQWDPTSLVRLATGGHGNGGTNVAVIDTSTHESILCKTDRIVATQGALLSYNIPAVLSSSEPLQGTPIGPATYVLAVHSDTNRYISITSVNLWYDVAKKGVIMGNLNDGSNQIDILDKNCGDLKDNCWFTPSGSHVLFSSSIESSLFGCPVISLFDVNTLQWVDRFCSPYPVNFRNIAIVEESHERLRIAVLAEDGKIFNLILQKYTF
eukprot:gene12975-17400_t